MSCLKKVFIQISMFMCYTSSGSWQHNGVYIRYHKGACCYQNHHPSHANNNNMHYVWFYNEWTHDNICSVLRAVFMPVHLFGQSSCSSAFSSNVITRGGGVGVNENGMDPIEAFLPPSLPPPGDWWSNTPLDSHSSPSSPAAVLSLSELAARAAGVGVDMHATSLSRLWFFSLCVSHSLSLSLLMIAPHILLPPVFPLSVETPPALVSALTALLLQKSDMAFIYSSNKANLKSNHCSLQL